MGNPSDGTWGHCLHQMRKDRHEVGDRIQNEGIHNHSSALHSHFFVLKGYFGGEYNAVVGKIMHKKKTLYTFSGKWDKQLVGKDLRDKVHTTPPVPADPILFRKRKYFGIPMAKWLCLG